ncbi:MAG: hypothetical protein IJY15_13865 [Thermoguttaceae bacterium]|nr:hypothetical protein [Thermoguttaceae bacterium]MBQ9128831.1 hypothetical protein [Thermoguttaceae bacterium]
MKKRRRQFYRRRPRNVEEIGDDGQDSFLDVVSNLVGVLIILVMVAGTRARNADAALEKAAEPTAAEQIERAEQTAYVDAAKTLVDARKNLVELQTETDDLNARTLDVERQADAAESEFRVVFQTLAEIDAEIELASRRRGEADKIAFDLKSEIFEKEKKRDDLRQEKDALAAARPQATVLENLPTPISRPVEGREGFFRLKNGRLSHVPLNEFQERVRLYFKNFRGDFEKKEIEDAFGPSEGYTFHFFVDLEKRRSGDEIVYSANFRYGECVPSGDELGEPVDEALSNPDSVFREKLLKYVRDDTTITVFVYQDSFEYLRDVKKFIFSAGYQLALRPLPDNAPIAVSPDGTDSTTY